MLSSVLLQETLQVGVVQFWLGVITILVTIIYAIVRIMIAWNQKVDKSEFDKHCCSNDDDFKDIQEKQNVQLEKMNNLLSQLVQNQTSMAVDIEWIKKKL